MLGKFGFMELVVILLIALVVFGPSKLPQIGSSLGQAISEFKKTVGGAEKDLEEAVKSEKEEGR